MSVSSNRSLLASFGHPSGGNDHGIFTSSNDHPASLRTTNNSKTGDNSHFFTQKYYSNDFGLTIIIFFLVPLFFIQLAESCFPIPSISQINSTTEEINKYEQEVESRKDFQYVFTLILAGFGVGLSVLLSYYQLTSQAAIRGIRYGSLACFVIAVYTHTSRLNPNVRVTILAVLIISCLLLPRLTADLEN